VPLVEKSPLKRGFRDTPLCDLALSIEGTALEPVLREFEAELDARAIRPKPHCYLSTDWGVPFPSISIGIPFYLAHPELLEMHGERVGHFEGVGRAQLLRYLRHEMGHVINYAYELYNDEDWVKQFGSMTQPYLEDYRPTPFSRRYVRHLPGWYAQKHPDEDWAETFAVWMTPGDAWRSDYAEWPTALAKLEYCDRTMRSLRERLPVITTQDADDSATQLPLTAEEFYRAQAAVEEKYPQGLDGALKAIFEDLDSPQPASGAPRRPASELIRRLRMPLAADVFRWTGHFPERTHDLLRHLAQRADSLQQLYPEDRETAAAIGLTTLVTALAMNYVHRGSYLG
jgi:hypothetical protein